MQFSRVILFVLLSFFAHAQQSVFNFLPIDASKGLSDNQVRYIMQLGDGRMVFKTSGNINIYDGHRFTYIHSTSRTSYPLTGYNGFYRMYRGGDSLLWIKDRHKLMLVNLRREQYVEDLGRYFKNAGFNKPVEDIYVDSGNRLWLYNSGMLHRYNSKDVVTVTPAFGKLQDVASHGKFLYLFFDTGKVAKYDLKSLSLHTVNAAYGMEQYALFCNTSLVVAAKNGFYQLRNGIKGGFFYFDAYKNSWQKLLETDYALNMLSVNDQGKAFISCTNGMWVVDCHNLKKQYFPTLKKVNGSIIDTEVSTLCNDRQGGLWLGTFNQGLLYYHPSRSTFTHIGKHYFKQKGTKDIIIHSFAEGKDGTMYIKSGTEIYTYSPFKNGSALENIPRVSVPHDQLADLDRYEAKGYSESNMPSLVDSRGWKWTGMQDGLKVAYPAQHAEKVFYTTDGLSNNFIHGIIEDRGNNIWVTTSFGITKLEINAVNHEINFIRFTPHEGTIDAEFADNAIFEASDGRLYFGGINGFNTYRPHGTTGERSVSFKPVFSNFYVHGQKVAPGKLYDGRTLLRNTAPYTTEIALSYNQNFLTFEFAALNYKNPSQTRYRYQLEGLDEHWQEPAVKQQDENLTANSSFIISYTNLPPGVYTLKVVAYESGYKSSNAVSRLHITISPPWWETGAARTSFTLLFIAFLGGSVYLYTSNAKKKAERLHREEILLLRIKSLIEQSNYPAAEKDPVPGEMPVQKNSIKTGSEENKADEAFLAKALDLVENNLSNPGYSVEQLSRDLCMDRTGLYRKLVALLDKPPSLFIRNIRLQRASALLLEGGYTISEITDIVGFSSPSYLSKCFQEMYGCRPSEYAEYCKKST